MAQDCAGSRTSSVSDTPNVLVLGIGNLLWADEGFGVRAVDELHRHYAFGPNVRVITIADLIGEAISRTASEESVSSLFD